MRGRQEAAADAASCMVKGSAVFSPSLATIFSVCSGCKLRHGRAEHNQILIGSEQLDRQQLAHATDAS
jgi:hypothetical protein